VQDFEEALRKLAIPPFLHQALTQFLALIATSGAASPDDESVYLMAGKRRCGYLLGQPRCQQFQVNIWFDRHVVTLI